MSSSPSFGTAVARLDSLREAVATFVARAAVKLRREGLACGHLTVFVQTNPFNAQDRQYSNACSTRLTVETDDTPDLIGHAMKLLLRLYRDGYRYKNAGVMMAELVLRDRTQAGLFDEVDRPRSAALMTVLDQINAKMGRDTLKCAAQGVGQTRGWPTRRDALSPRYTTCWDDLPVARC